MNSVESDLKLVKEINNSTNSIVQQFQENIKNKLSELNSKINLSQTRQMSNLAPSPQNLTCFKDNETVEQVKALQHDVAECQNVIVELRKLIMKTEFKMEIYSRKNTQVEGKSFCFEHEADERKDQPQNEPFHGLSELDNLQGELSRHEHRLTNIEDRLSEFETQIQTMRRSRIPLNDHVHKKGDNLSS